MSLPASPSGWIILDKPVGLGSTQGVAAVKRNLRQAGFGKTVKVGHGGTLDPLATGVLPIAVGEATKLCGRMLDAAKIYDFTVAFGTETDTLDLEGKAIATSDVRPALSALEAVLPRFTGPIEQVPPAYSALMVDGDRAYDLARAGQDVTLPSRPVTIHALAVLGVEGEGGALSAATLRAHVSKGTYIRSLAQDIGVLLGTGAYLSSLCRTRIGAFTLEGALTMEEAQKLINENLDGIKTDN